MQNRLVPLILAVALFMENMDSTVIATSLAAIAHDIGYPVRGGAKFARKLDFLAGDASYRQPQCFSFQQTAQRKYIVRVIGRKRHDECATSRMKRDEAFRFQLLDRFSHRHMAYAQFATDCVLLNAIPWLEAAKQNGFSQFKSRKLSDSLRRWRLRAAHRERPCERGNNDR